ncbi:hypothetical protein [Runella sp.]|uniref:hypothetical protein n=1 Tax=Runella sp. TaxID=1960881 RepID=UPI003D150402
MKKLEKARMQKLYGGAWQCEMLTDYLITAGVGLTAWTITAPIGIPMALIGLGSKAFGGCGKS